MLRRQLSSSLRLAAFGSLLTGLASVACDRPASQTTTTSATTPTPAQTPALSPSETRTAAAWATKLDPEMKAVLDELTALGGKPIETLGAEDARKQPTPADAVMEVLKKQGKSTAPEEIGRMEERTIPTPGGKLPLRIYTPTGKGPFPVVVYYHGGGWVIATNDTYDASARTLANGAQAVVASVEYRKAPENKFPAAHDDALAAYEWVLKNAASIGGDPAKIAVAGESAGGNMAIDVAIAARDKHEKLPVHELLIYPVASSDMNSPSQREYADAKPLNHAMMGWFTGQYLRTPADANDPRINVVAANLKGLPPTTIINAEIDPLRTDGETLATKLRAAGVAVEQRTYPGVTHEFFGMGPVVWKAKDAETLATSRLKGAFIGG